jgi:RNA polymerase sigma-70 factor, ECF subfamily
MLALTVETACEKPINRSDCFSARLPRNATSFGRETSDEALIKAIACGNRHAMERLYKRHHVRVYRFVLRLTGNESLAEDVVSEVFFDVWRQAGRFKGQSQVYTWLLAIARNKSISVIRRRKEGPLDDDTPEVKDLADDPEVTVQKNDRSMTIGKCLSQLSVAQREVVDLIYYHEKSVEEVAQIVGAPASTVKTRMFYARRRIEQLLRARGLEGI